MGTVFILDLSSDLSRCLGGSTYNLPKSKDKSRIKTVPYIVQKESYFPKGKWILESMEIGSFEKVCTIYLNPRWEKKKVKSSNNLTKESGWDQVQSSKQGSWYIDGYSAPTGTYCISPGRSWLVSLGLSPCLWLCVWKKVRKGRLCYRRYWEGFVKLLTSGMILSVIAGML